MAVVRKSDNKIKELSELTEADIQEIIYANFAFQKFQFLIPNSFTYQGEQDMIGVTKKSRLSYEFEIKISVQDFKNDFKNKIEKHSIYKTGKIPDHAKRYFDSLEDDYNKEFNKKMVEKYTCRPNYFYYVVPQDLISVEDIPDYAGLYYIRKNSHEMKIIKKAKKLHKDRVNNDQLINMLSKTYYKYWKARRGRN